MSEVYFHLRSPEASGFAIGEIWRAFAHTAFDRLRFTALYGPDIDLAPVIVTVPGGDYWVQLKLSRGDMTRELVRIPDQPDVFEVVLEIPWPNQLGEPAISAISSIGQIVPTTVDTVARPPRSVPLGVPALPDNARQTRGFVLPRAPISLPTFSLDHIRQIKSQSSDDLYLNSDLLSQFSLTSLARVRANFLAWPRRLRRPRALARYPGLDFIQPSNYFTSTLRYATQLDSLSVVVDGDSLIAEIPRLGVPDFKRSSKDVVEGRVKRDLAVVKDDSGRARILVTIPNGWGGSSARLRITKNALNFSQPLKVEVEVDDPKSNALLQFIKRGDLDSAIQVIESSVELLYGKFRNPFAAAAAGYVLIQAAPRTLRVPWQVWIGNLARNFGDLPDSEILHATLLLQRGDTLDEEYPHAGAEAHYFPRAGADRNQLAARLILSALGKGPPMFRPGLSFLASNLRILSSVELTQEVRLLLDEAEKLVTWLSMQVDPIEPFSVFHLRE